MTEQIKQNQQSIDKFIADLDNNSKKFRELYSKKVEFILTYWTEEYNRMQDEIQKEQQTIFEKFRNNRY